jgi:two-component system alkaline phosphatase synthesis response regulator PhoP
MAQKEKILIVEDDENIMDVVEIHLRDLGYDVDKAMDGDSGLEKALNNSYPLIILDLMLPGRDGFDICRNIRQENPYTPILMLTARQDEVDKVLGLEFGADDYITKPFSVREFIARVKAILRRIEVDKDKGSNAVSEDPLMFGDLHIDFVKRKVLLGRTKLELTAKEFDLLSLFAKRERINMEVFIIGNAISICQLPCFGNNYVVKTIFINILNPVKRVLLNGHVDGGAKTQMQLFIRHVVKLVVVAHIVKSARLLEQKGGICIFQVYGADFQVQT